MAFDVCLVGGGEPEDTFLGACAGGGAAGGEAVACRRFNSSGGITGLTGGFSADGGRAGIRGVNKLSNDGKLTCLS